MKSESAALPQARGAPRPPSRYAWTSPGPAPDPLQVLLWPQERFVPVQAPTFAICICASLRVYAQSLWVRQLRGWKAPRWHFQLSCYPGAVLPSICFFFFPRKGCFFSACLSPFSLSQSLSINNLMHKLLIILITLSSYKALRASEAPHKCKSIHLFNTQRMEVSESYKLLLRLGRLTHQELHCFAQSHTRG